MRELSKEFIDGEPLLSQSKVGEMVPLRMVHPWGLPDMYQVRLLHHDQELCISGTVRERELALSQAKQWMLDEAKRIMLMRAELM
jgi:hypothetical protein